MVTELRKTQKKNTIGKWVIRDDRVIRVLKHGRTCKLFKWFHQPRIDQKHIMTVVRQELARKTLLLNILVCMYTHTKKREQSTSKVGSKKIKWFSQGFRISQKRTRSTHKKGLNETFQNIIFFGAAKSCYYFYARFIIIYFFCFCFCTFVVISLFQHFIIYLALFANILFECRDCFLTENWFYTFFHYNIIVARLLCFHSNLILLLPRILVVR